MSSYRMLQWPGTRRGACICVDVYGDVCREDLEEIMKVLEIALRSWPTAAELEKYWQCDDCEARFEQEKMIPVRGGKRGCPSCGGPARPLLPLPGGDARPSGRKEE